jgi:hypothetical protein
MDLWHRFLANRQPITPPTTRPESSGWLVDSQGNVWKYADEWHVEVWIGKK